MLKELPRGRFLEWFAFDQVDPIGGRRGDWQAAAVCSQVTNIAAAKSGSKHRTRPADFMLEYGPLKERPKVEEDKPKSWQELKFIAQMWVADDHANQQRKRKR